MYQYNDVDREVIHNRVEEFQGQVNRFFSGELTDDQFKSLRLLNGLYVERQAPMLRVAIPYGELSSQQLRKLADIAVRYDRGYGHITTRQNIQFNWLEIPTVPGVLKALSEVEMHAVQASGNCIRNITADHLAGLSPDEVDDPRAYCELVRQWANFHPEFSFLPRKFKIAIIGSPKDRAASQVHDVGLHLKRNALGEIGFEVFVGGGLGRTPFIASQLSEFLPREDLLSYLEAILRVYNLNGRRDNKYKARIKILVNSMGIDRFRAEVETQWRAGEYQKLRLSTSKFANMAQFFPIPEVNEHRVPADFDLSRELSFPDFADWKRQNTCATKHKNYCLVYLPLKAQGSAPGDITASQMRLVADIADEFSFGQIRTTHTQNMLLPHVKSHQLFELWGRLNAGKLAAPVIGTVNDVICCPGREFCSLANAESIPVAMEIQNRFSILREALEFGDIQVKISGCMNACGHHHVGHIGILGVDKKGSEWYQITLGGSANEHARLGDRLGPAVPRASIANVVEIIIRTYVSLRQEEESFLETYCRVGIAPFKEAAYE